MNRAELIRQMGETTEARMKLMGGKSDDYASQEDTLSNFKRMNVLCKTLDVDPRRSAFDCAMFLELLKTDRICNLHKKGTTPKNESVRDTVMDKHNYLDIAYALLEEEAKATQPNQ